MRPGAGESPSLGYSAALYMRLSKDDEGTAESASISAQRKQLHSYAKENGFGIYSEYVDDGYSGTSFIRPAWNRLLEDIEAKHVNLVITKDLSRLGRNYIMTGQFTEVYFPAKGVRYIAINDGYDSESQWNDIAPFKNIVNEMYARDTSRKIRSSLQTKIKEGAFIGNFAPYGYQKDPEDKNHLLIDPAAASIVREIFEKAEKGEAPSRIAGDLNKREVLTPAMYRCARLPYLNADNYSRRKEWTPGAVCKILANQVYLGHMVQGKTAKASFKSAVTLQKPRKDWVVVKNRHEPIISQEVFDRVRKRSVSRRNPAVSGFSNLFSGTAVCSDCGRNMSITGARGKTEKRKLVCGGYKLYGSRECTNHFMDYDLLYEILVQEMCILLPFTEREKEEILRALWEDSGGREPTFGKKAGSALKKREREIETIILRLYEDQINGKIQEERFYKMLDAYEREQKEIAVGLAALQKPDALLKTNALLKSKERDGESLLAGLIEEVEQNHFLSADLFAGFIERIEICQSVTEEEGRSPHKFQTIRIYYRLSPEGNGKTAPA